MKATNVIIFFLLLLLAGSIIQSTANLVPNEDETDTTDTDHSDSSHTDTTDSEHTDTDHTDTKKVDSETKDAYERKVEVEEADHEWKIKSEAKTGETKDKFEAEFHVGGGDKPEVKFKYASEGANSSSTELKYRVSFSNLIEFTEVDNVSGYSQGQDTVVSTYKFDKVDWNPISYSTDTVGSSVVHVATVSTTDGVFTLVLRLATGITDINNTVITPNAIKIDVIISGYSYQGNGTYIALRSDIKTESEMKVNTQSEDEQKGFATNEEQVSVNGAGNQAFFSWAESADADGQTIDVISSPLVKTNETDTDLSQGESQKVIFFTFDAQNPDTITWDPKVGISIDLTSIPAIASALAGLPVSILAILAIFVLIPLRRRR